MITAIALDDEPPALKVLENFCRRVDFISLEKTFSRPAEALAYLKKFPVDLLFLDIQMPSMLGTDFYRQVAQDTMVIFTTAFSEYAVEGFDLSAVDYLMKPFPFERFEQAVGKARDYQRVLGAAAPGAPGSLYLRVDYGLVKIAFTDVLYVEGLDDYVIIYLSRQPRVVARMTLKTLAEKMPERDFVRVHRSFIVAIDRIEQVRNKLITIAGREIPIGRNFEAGFFARFGG